MTGNREDPANGMMVVYQRLAAQANPLVIVGGILNIVVVAFGVRDVLAWPVPVALGFAVFLIAMQYVLGTSVSGRGLVNAVGCSILYLFVILVNLVLAVSGIVAIASPDALGRRSFKEVSAGPRERIIAVADNMNRTELELSTLSRLSNRRAAAEAAEGFSCGPSKPGEGPIFRLRTRDRDRFAELGSDFSNRAAAMRQVRVELDAAIAGYAVNRHGQVASRIDALVERARQAAGDPAIGAMRSELRTRLAGVRHGVVDPPTGVTVQCPDGELEKALASVLAVEPPSVPAVEALPSEPSHRAAALAFVRQIQDVRGGAPFDAEMWSVPVTLGFFPDAVFLVGLMQLKRDRRRRLGIAGKLARHVTAKGESWADAATAAKAAAEVLGTHWLLRCHSRKSRWFGHTDCLTVPADGHLDAFLQCLGLVRIGHATYHGRGPAKLLLEGAFPRPPEGEADSHFFILRRRTWERLLVEAMRNPEWSPRPDGAGEPAEGEEWSEAAE